MGCSRCGQRARQIASGRTPPTGQTVWVVRDENGNERDALQVAGEARRLAAKRGWPKPRAERR